MFRRRRNPGMVVTATTYTRGEVLALVTGITDLHDGEVCNYVVIALKHPDHRPIIVSPDTNQQRMIRFLEKVIENAKEGQGE